MPRNSANPIDHRAIINPTGHSLWVNFSNRISNASETTTTPRSQNLCRNAGVFSEKKKKKSKKKEKGTLKARGGFHTLVVEWNAEQSLLLQDRILIEPMNDISRLDSVYDSLE